jgi:Asp-tRNA(Asn)/Glu-tRNA(Gln) amidotransferase C subunit
MKVFESEEVQETLEGLDEIISYFETMYGGDLDSVTVLKIALKVQENSLRLEHNKLYAAANVVDTVTLVPSALEKIAMELERFNNNN